MSLKRLLTAAAIAATLLAGQEILNNDSIVKMVKAGLGEPLITAMVHNQPGKYSLNADDLLVLKQQGVPENVLTAMVNKNFGSATPEATASAAGKAGITEPNLDVPRNIEIGVYYKKAGQWEEMSPEVVTWKTGGVLKTIATNGIIKGDSNGHLQGPDSRNSANSPLDVVVYTPEGVSITEYQLVQLHRQKNSREFRTVTGGVFHSSGGATRDVLAFESTKIASRTFRISLPRLESGEYGFLPPGAVGSSSSASIGKLYSFRLVE